ncbi:MAG: hypothetical protein KC897_09990 [Candidatus Omnitrophica bacterium]|nr:hypothetical protein [Candidatus Omnitrophota bacterium]MCB9721436.1 hypothetical protein [Candidatus Omnitrophota bacterium]
MSGAEEARRKARTRHILIILGALFIGLNYHTVIVYTVRADQATKCGPVTGETLEEVEDCRNRIRYWDVFFRFRDLKMPFN